MMNDSIRKQVHHLLLLLAALALGFGGTACASAGASALDLMSENTDEGIAITTSGPGRFERDREDALDDVERMKDEADGETSESERSQ